MAILNILTLGNARAQDSLSSSPSLHEPGALSEFQQVQSSTNQTPGAREGLNSPQHHLQKKRGPQPCTLAKVPLPGESPSARSRWIFQFGALPSGSGRNNHNFKASRSSYTNSWAAPTVSCEHLTQLISLHISDTQYLLHSLAERKLTWKRHWDKLFLYVNLS